MIRHVVVVPALASYDGLVWVDSDVFYVPGWNEKYPLYQAVENPQVWVYRDELCAYIWEDTDSTKDDGVETLLPRLFDYLRTLSPDEEDRVFRDESVTIAQYLAENVRAVPDFRAEWVVWLANRDRGNPAVDWGQSVVLPTDEETLRNLIDEYTNHGTTSYCVKSLEMPPELTRLIPNDGPMDLLELNNMAAQWRELTPAQQLAMRAYFDSVGPNWEEALQIAHQDAFLIVNACNALELGCVLFDVNYAGMREDSEDLMRLVRRYFDFEALGEDAIRTEAYVPIDDVYVKVLRESRSRRPIA